jgi:hypothetical protein
MPDPESFFPPAASAAAIEHEARRHRIMERVRRGWSYERIAPTETLTPQRIGQIVRESLARLEVDPADAHVRLQTARLEASLRLAAERVAEGDLGAIDRLLRVLVQLDRYHARAVAPAPFDAQAEAAARRARRAGRREGASRARGAGGRRPAGLHGFWFPRKPLISRDSRK